MRLVYKTQMKMVGYKGFGLIGLHMGDMLPGKLFAI